MNKNRNIIGALQEFFANNKFGKEINSISIIMSSIRTSFKRHCRATQLRDHYYDRTSSIKRKTNQSNITG